MQMVRIAIFQRKHWGAKTLVLKAMRLFGEQAKTRWHNFREMQDLWIAISVWQEEIFLLTGLLKGWWADSFARVPTRSSSFD